MSNGSRLIRNDKVRKEIHRLKAELANGIMLDARQSYKSTSTLHLLTSPILWTLACVKWRSLC